MPELPEVESLLQGVRPEIIGKSFSKIIFYRDDIREKIPKNRLKQILLNKEVNQVVRRGKYLLIGTNDGYLGIHLGMSGRFVRSKSTTKLADHTHAVFEVSSEFQYRFVDPRRFGRLFCVEINELETHPFLSRLGLEPLDSHADLSGHLFRVSRKRTQPIKNFIMDNGVVVGVGNIYASEALWTAGIHPQERACDVSQAGYVGLSEAIFDVLTKAISAGGTTFRDYRDKDGNPGYFQNKLAVYGKISKPCPRCSGEISRLVQGGRSTFFCSFCQSIKKRQ